MSRFLVVGFGPPLPPVAGVRADRNTRAAKRQESRVRWYLRSGKRIKEKRVRDCQRATATWRRTGRGGHFPCTPQPAVADSIEKMSLIEFARFSGHFTYRI